MNQDAIDRFYKEVDDIESLNKADKAGSLRGYFQHRVSGDKSAIIWLNDPGTKIRNAVIIAANKFLST